MSKSQLSILIQLAKVDGTITQDEINLIHEIGSANGMSASEIKESVENPYLVQDLSDLADEDRFNYLLNIIQLMKVDGRMFRDEIKYCSKMAAKLGYDESVLFELITQVNKDKVLDKDQLRERIAKYNKR